MSDELDDDYGLEWGNNMRVITAIEAMYKSGVFNKEEMRNWEQKDEAKKCGSIYAHILVTCSTRTNNTLV